MQEIARLGLLRTFQTTRIYGKMNCMQNMLISIPHRKAGFLDMFARERGETVERAEQLLAFVGLYEKRLPARRQRCRSASRSCWNSPWR